MKSTPTAIDQAAQAIFNAMAKDPDLAALAGMTPGRVTESQARALRKAHAIAVKLATEKHEPAFGRIAQALHKMANPQGTKPAPTQFETK